MPDPWRGAKSTRSYFIIVSQPILPVVEEIEAIKTKDLLSHDPIGVELRACRMTSITRKVRAPTNAAEPIFQQIGEKQSSEENQGKDSAGIRKNDMDKLHKKMALEGRRGSTG